MKEEQTNAPATTTQPTPPTFERDEDFLSEYANSARFESTVYDLKIIFGQTDLGSGSEIIRQHTGITIPWALVKIMLYFLQINLMFHEAHNGKVLIPPTQIPAPFPESPPPEAASDPVALKALEAAKEFREEFLAKL
jgi:hypothetical protein